MTKAQEGRYWREWGKVRKVLIDLGEFSKADADAERHAIHREALGKEKSHKDFTNPDLNKVFDAFDKILVLANGPSDGLSRDAKNIIWSIERTGLPEPYLESIARDQFDTAEWRKLDLPDLAKFRFTAVSRTRTRRKAAKAADEPF